MLRGIISKGAHPGWYAGCDVIGAYTQGESREDAFAMLADAIETLVDREGFEVNVIEADIIGTDEYEVLIDSEQPELLAATVLRQQRLRRKLSLSDVAKRLGVSSISSYADYEAGRRAPSLAKFREMLAAVAPDLALTIGPKKRAK